MAATRLLTTVAIAALALAGCDGSDRTTAQVAPTPTPTATPTPTPSPQVVEAGEPFTIGQYEFTDWAPLATSLEVTTLAGVVNNRGDAFGAASFDVTFFIGSVVLARFHCASGPLQPGESENVVCDQTTSSVASAPHEPPFDRITAVERAK